jgi:YegS/Rv2252/BmrU family lipid kinase
VRPVERLLVVVNPNASRAADALPQIAGWFAGRANATIVETKQEDELEQILRHQGPINDRIVIGGGDGTLSKALPLLLELNKPAAVLPLGTANDFARTLGLPTNTREAAQVAMEGREHRIDVGLVNGRPYLNVASVGVASQAIKSQSKELKRKWRVLAYPISLLRAAAKLRPIFVELDIDEETRWSAPVYQVSIANGRYHGGCLTAAEEAAIDDGKLHIYVVYPGSFWQLFACLTHLRFGLLKPTVLGRHTARNVTLRTGKSRAVNADGRIVTETPAKFALLPRSLTVMVPRKLPHDHRGLRAPAEAP